MGEPSVDTGVARTRGKRRREKRDPDATRRALLEAGARLFPEKGYDGVSVEEIATRARVNKALISYHFGGKRGLYVAALESAFAEMAARLVAIEAETAEARDGLHRLFRAFEKMTRERPDFPTLFLRDAVSSGIEPAVVPHLLKIVGVTRRLAERGLREGVFRRVDPLLLHFGLVGSLAFFFGTAAARQRARAAGLLPFAPPTPKAFISHLEEMTLRGLAPAPSAVGKTQRKSHKKRKGARS
jgi:TetR/AcrR family transcriptional regulator